MQRRAQLLSMPRCALEKCLAQTDMCMHAAVLTRMTFRCKLLSLRRPLLWSQDRIRPLWPMQMHLIAISPSQATMTSRQLLIAAPVMTVRAGPARLLPCAVGAAAAVMRTLQ